MGSIRRRVSTVDILSPAVAGDSGAKRSADAKLWEELAEVDCGCCELSLRRGGPGLPGLACLRITLGSTGLPSVEWLLPKLARVLNIGVDFVVTYDFRDHSPAPSFTRSLAEFWREHMEQCAASLKSTALLVKDNLFDMATQSQISGFIQACVLGQPFVVCHAEASAEEFFRAGAAEAPPAREKGKAAPFLSVVDVQEASQPTSPQSCIASLAPLGRHGGPAFFPEAHTFHTLPNGDVRVIQSPPQDIMKRMDSTWHRDREEQGPAEAHVGTPAADPLPGCVPSAVAALSFACPREQMRQLIGAHFHLGELVIDAEMESVARTCSKPMTGAGGSQASLSRDFNFLLDACAAGLHWLLVRVFRRRKPAPEKESC